MGSEHSIEKHRHILEHALGNRSHYRNHFVSGPGAPDWGALLWLVEQGYMVKSFRSWVPDPIFFVTEKGKAEAFQGAEGREEE
jgi:hypothetical protein